MSMCARPKPLLLLSVFKNQNKTDDGDVFWGIFGYVSLLKLEKDIADDNRYSVLWAQNYKKVTEGVFLGHQKKCIYSYRQ